VIRRSFVLCLRAEWRRRKAYWITGAPAVRRDAKPWVEGLERRALLASITEYPITVGTPSLGNGLVGITGGPAGNVYFTDTLNNAVGQITPSGVITELPVPAPANGGGFFKNGLDGIILGADKKLTFTESTQGAIAKITTSGSYSQYPIDSTGNDTSQGPDQITTTSDGTLWWTEGGANSIGELTTAGVFQQYPVPNATHGGIIGPSLKGITAGSDGNIWFTNWGSSGDFVGMITPTGSITEFPLPFGTDPSGIANGPDGNLWFAAYGSNTIDVMSTSGALLHQYPVASGQGLLNDITVGSDNNLYFTAGSGDIGEITTSGVVTNFPVSATVPTVPGASGPQPLAITSGPDGNIWFTDPWTDSIGVLKIASSSPNALPTLTALTASTTSAALGQSVTVTATVSDLSPGGDTPTGGTVTFSDQNGAIGSATMIDGVAMFTTSSLAAGANAVTASYGGTTDFAPSTTGTAVTVTISAAGSVFQWSTASGGNGHYFELVLPADPSGNYSWTQADAAAGAMTYDGSPGYLATVTSAAENDFLGSHFQSSLAVRMQGNVPTFVPGDLAWIGLTDVGQTGDWTWVTGEPFSYSNWSVGEPNNPGVEDWVEYWNVENNGVAPPVWSWNNAQNVVATQGGLQGFIVEFNGPTAIAAASSSATFSPASQTVPLSATVTSGAYMVNAGTVTFTILSGKMVIGSAVTINVMDGSASASYVLPAGTLTGIYTIQAVYNGTTDFPGSTDTSHSLTVNAGAAYQIVFEQQPTDAVAGVAISPAVTVEVEDQYHNLVTTNGSAVTLTLSSGTFAGGSSTVTAVASHGVATFSGLKIDLAGNYTLSATDATLVPTRPSDSFTITAATAAQPTIIGEQVVMMRKKNRKGKPVGKPVLAGFTLDYSTAMNPMTAGLAANYQVDSATTKRVHKKTSTTFKQVALNAAYDPSHNSATLYIQGKHTFAQGGRIKVIYSPPSGVSSEGGVPLDASDTEFTILLNGTRIMPG
jgi:streptogramin lyase